MVTRYVTTDALDAITGVAFPKSPGLLAGRSGVEKYWQDIDSLGNQIQKGHTYTEKGFLSTSGVSDKNVMQDKGVLLRIKVPKGTNAYYVDIIPFYNFIVSEKPVTDIYALLSNFDFTANALGYNLKTGDFYNPVGGMEDIRNRILRAVQLDFPEKPVSPSIPLSAVSVFWFRLLHYQHKLEFRFDGQTERWVLDNSWRYSKDIAAFEKYFFKPVLSSHMSRLLKIER